ncbi:phosphonate degradation HD-domain oxygenase [Aureliella helgolandensis]|uniref:HD domain protein n=1 Tax=Aureliella helgolandensis TaxID=2527968 RepID=A0A518GGU7_9BACT|nr:phosphonate degradation HD-domain oxygenase [Aureliella helgolandensis]QDV27803.1 HD domain protein [Aureliella helgolandensis]
MTPSTLVSRIGELFKLRGNSEYGGESVTQLEHALQCAALAEQHQAPPELIVAALLHDVGHLLHELPDDAPDQGVDDHHEKSGYRYLEKYFDQAVTEPVRQHVDAKRYLCAVDPEYAAQLSEPSQVSLALQGGPMSATELSEFRQTPFWQESLQLRKWDDQAKVVDLATPPLEHFLAFIDPLVVSTDEVAQ